MGSVELSSRVYLRSPKSQITDKPQKTNTEHTAPSILRLSIQIRKDPIKHPFYPQEYLVFPSCAIKDVLFYLGCDLSHSPLQLNRDVLHSDQQVVQLSEEAKVAVAFSEL